VAVARTVPVSQAGKGAVLTLQARAGVVRELALDDRRQGVSVPGFGRLSLQGYDKDETRALFGLGASLSLGGGVAGFLDYGGEWGGDATLHTGSAGLRLTF
jgi:hypothetical protein